METVLTSKSETLPALCVHCDKPLLGVFDSRFCCRGCETVYALLQDRGLGKYYDIKSAGRSIRKPVSADHDLEDFAYLDDPDFLSSNSWVISKNPPIIGMKFYLEGVHCAACIWLTEKVAEFVAGVGQVRLNLSTSVATVTLTGDGKFSEVAAEFQKMGYRPHPVKNDENDDLQKKENRLFLIRLGVAGAATGNIMLLAISLYAGVTGHTAEVFRFLSFALFLPVILFSAVPFYQSSIAAIRHREPSIDIPVVFGILVGALASVYNLFTGDERIYFDSLSMLVFLLLSTRYFLKRIQQSAMGATHLLRFLTPSTGRRKNESGLFEEVSVDRIRVGDLLQIFAGECIPVDGTVVTGSSFTNCSFLTGESRPEAAVIGKTVYAGTVNLEAPIEIRVTRPSRSTRLASILETMEATLKNKAHITVFADRVSRYFAVGVIGITFGLFALGLVSHWHENLNRALAVALVTCPCAFAFATPLALSLTLGRLARAGVLVKTPEVLERLTQIKNVFLDKTGTLTQGKPTVTAWTWAVGSTNHHEIEAAVLALESQSRHPIARAITSFLSDQSPYQMSLPSEFSEKIGRGISGKVSSSFYQIQRAANATEGTEVSVFQNDVLVATIKLTDQIRPESIAAVQDFQKQGLHPWILSGDTRSAVHEVAASIGIAPSYCKAEVSPEEKSNLVRKTENALMIGDGANDAIALASAHVGVAVHSGVEISMRAADVYLSRPGVKPISHLLVISRETLKVIYRSFGFSILYNLIAGIAAFYGKIDPLSAAILMPASALTVFLSAIAGTRKMRRAFRSLEIRGRET